ncbi:MAG TPA: dienelactone hydrolase family protein [Candidatus Methylomirabilis sp.]|nr:dienelactone hydrolase family protein [Candidatus Methylomirabilis sp.]
MPTSMSVTFSSEAGQASGHLARPGKAVPGVIVIQEWWGLVPHIKDVAGRFAAQGYLALAPDLYHGKTTVEAAEAEHLLKGLDWARAAKEIAGAVRHLREVEGATRVGVVGFCMGGALTIIAATQPGVNAYAAFYGFPPAGAAPLEKIAAPGLLLFGEQEPFFSVPDAKAFADGQRKRGRQAEVIIYPGAGHAFFNDTRPEAYRQDAANDAWRRTLDLFGRHLRVG